MSGVSEMTERKVRASGGQGENGNEHVWRSGNVAAGRSGEADCDEKTKTCQADHLHRQLKNDIIASHHRRHK